MNFQAVMWFWLNPTSAAVAVGDAVIAGGQRHFNLGRNADLVRRFLKGAKIPQHNRVWEMPLQPHDRIGAFNLPIREDPQTNVRKECRIPTQFATSKGAYPLWKKSVFPIPAGAKPEQVALIFRDTSNQFHARIFHISQLASLPQKLAEAVFASRNSETPVHLWAKSGTLKRVVPRLTSPKPSLAPNTPPPKPTDWKSLAQKVLDLKDKPRKTRIRQVESRLRDPQTRDLALRCFGAVCQIENCVCTRELAASFVPFVTEVHHIKAVAKGGDDTVFNLAVLCANHHRLIERFPQVEVLTEPGSDDVLIIVGGEGLLIERDLQALRAELKG